MTTIDASGNIHGHDGRFSEKQNTAPVRGLSTSVDHAVSPNGGETACGIPLSSVEIRSGVDCPAYIAALQGPSSGPTTSSTAAPIPPTLRGVVEALENLPKRELAKALALAMAAAGREEDWDSGTIEHVLSPLVDLGKKVSLPSFTVAEEPGAIAFWIDADDDDELGDVCSNCGEEIADDDMFADLDAMVCSSCQHNARRSG